MPERFPRPEYVEISDEQLVSMLELGVERADVRATLESWTEQEENKVANDPIASIEFNRRRASLYRRAGYSQEAIDVLEDASAQAWNENRDELYKEILAEIAQIEQDSQ